MKQTHLEKTEFADNPEPRCAVVLLLDTSGSMHGAPIDELNKGLQEFVKALKADPVAMLRVELALINFGGTVKAIDFVSADQFTPTTLTATGNTPMGQAVNRGLEMLKQRKEIYKNNDLDYYRPWMFLITDGEPTDVWKATAEDVRQEEMRKGLSFYAVGVENANMQVLSEFSAQRQPLKLKGLAFGELFEWLSKSLSAVSVSRPG